jgi:hypothetical protein
VEDSTFFKGAKIIVLVTNTAKLVNFLLFTVPLKQLVKRKVTNNSHNSSQLSLGKCCLNYTLLFLECVLELEPCFKRT